jgi:chromosome partitioning protein
MRLTAIGNLKGGAGKTTLAFHLAVWLQYLGRPNLVFDFDPQRTLYDTARVRQEQGLIPALQVFADSRLFLQYLRRYRPDVQQQQSFPIENGQLPPVTEVPSSPLTIQEILCDTGMAERSVWRFLLYYLDRILIPLSPSQADLWATQRFTRFLIETAEQIGKPLPELYAVINRVVANDADVLDLQRALRALPKVQLLPVSWSQHQHYRQCFSEGVAGFELLRSPIKRESRQLVEAIYPAPAPAVKAKKRS